MSKILRTQLLQDINEPVLENLLIVDQQTNENEEDGSHIEAREIIDSTDEDLSVITVSVISTWDYTSDVLWRIQDDTCTSAVYTLMTPSSTDVKCEEKESEEKESERTYRSVITGKRLITVDD